MAAAHIPVRNTRICCSSRAPVATLGDPFRFRCSDWEVMVDGSVPIQN